VNQQQDTTYRPDAARDRWLAELIKLAMAASPTLGHSPDATATYLRRITENPQFSIPYAPPPSVPLHEQVECIGIAALQACRAATKTAERLLATGFEFTSGDAMQDEADLDWAWDGILPMGGTSMLVARAKRGKTKLAASIARSISRGEPFLGRATKKMRVYYLGLEGGPAYWSGLVKRGALKEDNIIWHRKAAPKNAPFQALADCIRTLGIGLVIVDTLARFSKIKDVKDYSVVVEAMEPFIDLARSTGCHVMAVHHSGKADGEGGDAVLGSEGLFGSVDTLLILKQDGNFRTLETEQRDGENLDKVRLPYNRSTGLIDGNVIPTKVAAVAELEMEKRLLESMQKIGPGASHPDVLKATPGKDADKIAGLARLLEKKVIRVEGAGRRNNPKRYWKC
jgi:hypothetical protein